MKSHLGIPLEGEHVRGQTIEEPPIVTHQQGRAGEGLEALLDGAMLLRDSARARKDFGTADSLRDSLLDAGVGIEDSAGGTTWSLERS